MVEGGVGRKGGWIENSRGRCGKKEGFGWRIVEGGVGRKGGWIEHGRGRCRKKGRLDRAWEREV